MATLPLIAPMLATPGRLPPAAVDEQWAYEVKQDGQRAMAYLPGDGSIRLLARSGAAITPAYPDLVALGPALGGVPAVLDGEIVALDEQGRSDFERLQSRMGLSGSPAKAARAAQRVPAHLVLFDVVFLGDRSLVRLPWTERRAALEGLGLDGPHWSTPAVVVGHGEQALAMTREAGLEGLVAKRLGSVYEPGVRARTWIKIRHARTADVIVGGWVPGRGRLGGLPGALLVGERHPGGLRYAGSVGTGWSDAERARLAELLRVAAVDDCPFDDTPPVAGARWVLPRLVGEVRYATRTKAGRLRQPSWHRLRPDLAPDDLEPDGLG
ncbi:ATP-dependent DNA ligase [[Kitasatospora] papulosa]|uniref:ATP-dependent DNA ligase n=1 Tax=Streptomyces TaxID=1883 RepID=UPI000BD0E3F5|nr:bifunctional non-homologous end joining protein LigD [Streptomyces pratensis]RAS36183.1 bifunctional non-homologous end joining protein LigD [Streptomyces avidinii]SNX71847.1 bifunctional non-homologous end joining protein LigD [Streptomyces microflavus]